MDFDALDLPLELFEVVWNVFELRCLNIVLGEFGGLDCSGRILHQFQCAAAAGRKLSDHHRGERRFVSGEHQHGSSRTRDPSDSTLSRLLLGHAMQRS